MGAAAALADRSAGARPDAGGATMRGAIRRAAAGRGARCLRYRAAA